MALQKLIPGTEWSRGKYTSQQSCTVPCLWDDADDPEKPLEACLSASGTSDDRLGGPTKVPVGGVPILPSGSTTDLDWPRQSSMICTLWPSPSGTETARFWPGDHSSTGALLFTRYLYSNCSLPQPEHHLSCMFDALLCSGS